MAGGAPHPGPLPIGSADSADAEREKRSLRQAVGMRRVVQGFKARNSVWENSHPGTLPLGEGVTLPVLCRDESGEQPGSLTGFKQTVGGCFPLPAGEGSRVREKTGHSYTAIVFVKPL